jgi:hypothetical protein
MLRSKTLNHHNKKGREVHLILQTRDTATTTMVVDQDQEAVVDLGAHHSAVETAGV